MSQRWLVKVEGCEQVSVLPSEQLEIGRRPIRPLVDNGVPRFEVSDETRSMSKRHALFTVAANGSAKIRDLHSTNGTYVVRSDGSLIRLPEDTDFPLPSSAIRMQFGDVPIDFVRVDEPAEERFQPVADLFDYALSDSKPEPDAMDLSVDDILNLRAGEPTSMFNAGSVARRASELKAAESRSFPPLRGMSSGDVPGDSACDDPFPDSMPINVMQPKTAQPRDLFADALADQEPSGQEPADQGAAGQSAAVQTPAAGTAEQTGAPASSEEQPASSPAAQSSSQAPVEETTSESAAPETSAAPGSAPADDAAAPADAAAPDDGQSREQTDQSQTDQSQPTGRTDQPDQTDQQQNTPVFTPLAQAAADAGASATTADPKDDEAVRFGAPDAAGTAGDAESGAYSPVFEPGSVFDRVSKGEFKQPEQTVEVNGFTSDEAKRTDDLSLQYEMANYPELLPFLALNPALYDDLYGWLAARGDRDIDAALANNPGYQNYRKVVRK